MLVGLNPEFDCLWMILFRFLIITEHICQIFLMKHLQEEMSVEEDKRLKDLQSKSHSIFSRFTTFGRPTKLWKFEQNLSSKGTLIKSRWLKANRCVNSKKVLKVATFSGHSYKVCYGVKDIKNGFHKLNFTLNYIDFYVIYTKLLS